MGVELFRIVSMMMVVCLHLLGHGGVLSSTAFLSPSYQLAAFFQVFTYCAVNCYALISGFANVKTEFKFRRFVLLWLETVFLLTLANTVAYFFIPSLTVNPSWWISGLFPLRKRELWYFCAYFFMYPLLPILNKGLLSLKRWQHIWIIVLLQVPTWFRVMEHKDNYVMSGGYSAIWLICLYVIGAYFRIYGAPKWAKWFVTLPVCFLSALGVWLAKILPERQLRSGLITKDSPVYENREELLSYVSPLVVIMSVMLLLFFMQLRIKRRIPKVLISHFGRATWGVFVLHVSSAFWYWYDFWDWFERFGTYPLYRCCFVCWGQRLSCTWHFPSFPLRGSICSSSCAFRCGSTVWQAFRNAFPRDGQTDPRVKNRSLKKEDGTACAVFLLRWAYSSFI